MAPLGTVEASCRGAARELAEVIWRRGALDDTLRVQPSGSVKIHILMRALAEDGRGATGRPPGERAAP